MSRDNILQALSNLDHANDNHWSPDGQPRIDTVRMLSGDSSITRDSIQQAAPGFVRHTQLSALVVEKVREFGKGEPAVLEVEQKVMVPDAVDSIVTQEVVNPTLDPDPVIEPVQSEDALTVATLRVSEARAKVDAAQRELHEACKAYDAIVDANIRDPRETHAETVRHYLASQRHILEQRAARKLMLDSSGINLNELARSLRSPLDSAMARRNNRGNGRPK